jgi:hypothetical protein
VIAATDKIKSGGAPARLLVVDDNPSALYATSRVLRSAGYAVLEARTGAAALAAAADADLIVLDVNLPDLDGFEVCRRLRLREDTARIPVLHLSATFTNAGDRALGFDAGADSYLTRPVEPPVLVATVRTLLFARHAETVRRGLDAKFRAMFASVPVAIAIMDEHFRYESVNPAYCALTGYRADDLIGQPGSTHVASPAGHLDSGIGSHGVVGRPRIEELQFRKQDGSISEVEWQIVKEDVSKVWIVVATDVTLRHRTEAARQSMLASERAARAEAERSNLLKEEFLATLSHELRNPLNAILGWATVLARKTDLPESVTQGLKAIARNSKFQAQMISDLLDYAGITFGKIRMVSETIDPYLAIRSAIEVVRPAADVAAVTIDARFSAEPLAIEADAARIQQLVVNLLSNAVKFSDKGGLVLLEAGPDGESLRVVVSDHGRGIEPDFVPRIFERFSQEEAGITRSRGGLGLGLAIVKQLADMHGGSVRAESPGLGKGAVFTLRIPLSYNKVAAAPDARKSAAMDFAGLTVLVVEDDADARALTRRILTDAGAAVVEASSAEEALARVAAAKPDILISDIGMPHEDGYQLVRRLRAAGYAPEALPAIALTAFARMEDRTEALAAGYQEHLVKPLDAPTLLSRVAMLCRRPEGGSP